MLLSDILFVPNYSNKPLLTACDEEYIMLIEVSEEFEKQKTDKTAREKYGTPAEIVLRKHLLSRKLNISLIAGVTIERSNIKNGLLFLKNDVDPNQTVYLPSQVKMVIEVKNNAVAGKALKDKKPLDPNKLLRAKFYELEATAKVKNFAVIVLSEMLLPPKSPYKWRFREDRIGKENCKVFTLVARQLYPPGGLYIKSNIEEMLKRGQMKRTEEFQKLIKYLQCL
jgi:hypothetical protein